MKSIFYNLLALATLATLNNLQAQTVADFENLSLDPQTYWNGVNDPLGSGFVSGNAYFPNYYDTSFGGFWSSGWAYSNFQDDTSSGYQNLYASFANSGKDGSANYVIGQNGAVVIPTASASRKVIKEAWLTNSTYAALSMANGDAFAKKFGGSDGNDPDWFKLTIRAWFEGDMKTDSVEFYLADYRFPDNNEDYILKEWTRVDLSGLGDVDSLSFKLSSSDVGTFGMNTPAFFCMDDFTTADATASIEELAINDMHLFPNPATSILYFDLKAKTTEKADLIIMDMGGKIIKQIKDHSSNTISLEGLQAGLYILSIQSESGYYTSRFIKQ